MSKSPKTFQKFSPRQNSTYRKNHQNIGRSYDQRQNRSFKRNDGNRSRNGSFNNQKRKKTREIFLVLHRLKGETSHRKVHTANQRVINLTILLSVDLPIDLRLVSRLTSKKFHKTIDTRHPMWSASLQLTIPWWIIKILPGKLIRSPKTNSNKPRNSKMSLKIYYFATGNTE